MKQPTYLLLGEILRPHAVRGELRIRVMTDYPERIAQLESVYLGSDPGDRRIKRYDVENMRMNKDHGLLKLKSVNDRHEADMLRGLYVMVHIDDAIPLEDDEIYLYQLIGLQVKTDDGELLGTISDIIETGANDVYVVQSDAYGEVLIPATDETILETNIEEHCITVQLPEGLLPYK